MKITPVMSVTLTNPAAKFGYYVSPSVDYEIDSSRNPEWQLDEGLYHDHSRGMVTLNPTCVPVDRQLSEWTVVKPVTGGATIDFQEIVCPKTSKKAVMQPAVGSDVAWSATSTANVDKFFYLDILKHYPAASATFMPSLKIEWPSSSIKRYRVGLKSTGGAYLQYTENSGTDWRIVDTLDATKTTGQDWSRLHFRIVNGHVYVLIDERSMHHHNKDADTLESAPVKLSGTGCSCAFSWYPGYYIATGNGYGGPVQVSTSTTETPEITIKGLKADGQDFTGTVTDNEDSTFNYQFTLDSTPGTNGLATTTPVMHRAHVKYPASAKVEVVDTTTTLNHIKNITEHVWFDPNTLNIYSEYTIECANEQQDFSWVSGLRACEINLGYAEIGSAKRMTGIAGYTMSWQSVPNSKTFTITARDRSAMLKGPAGIQVCNLPNMDGWSIYKAMRFLANYAGIGDEWLAFPIDDSDITDNPNDYYLLPYGDEFHPLIKFPGGMYVWDCMQLIQKKCGYLLYFDADGMLQFYPYIPSAPGALKKRFGVLVNGAWANGTAGAFGVSNLDEMFGVSRTRDMSQVRNDVTIIGIDPETWKPIVAHNRDDLSINDPAAQNYLGYRSSMVWADSMFCTADYASQTLDQTFGLVRLPVDVITLSGWMQHNLFPLDVISAYDPYSTDVEKPYYITSITNSLASRPVGNGFEIDPSCTIQAQWLTPWG